MLKAKVGSLNVDLRLNTARFESDTKKARRSANSFERQFKRSFNSTRSSVNRMFPSFNKLIGLIGIVAGPAALGLLTRSSLKSADALAKTSDKIGIATDELAALQFAGKLTGVSVETTNMALQRMVRRVSEAAQGTGEAQGALRELGIDAKALSKLPLDEQFRQIADSMSNVRNQGDRVRLSMKLFDSEGVALVNTLGLQREGLDAAEREARQLGITISRFDASKIEKANDDIERMQSVFGGVGNTIAIKVAPVISALSEEFIEAAKQTNGFSQQIDSGMRFAIKVIGFAADTVRGLQVVWLGLRQIVAEVVNKIIQDTRQIANAISAVINPVKRFFGGEEIEFTLINDFADSFQATTNSMREQLQSLATETMPSQAVDDFFDRAMERASEYAEFAEEKKLRQSTLGIMSDEELEALNKQKEQRLEFEKRWQDKLTSITEEQAFKRFQFEKMTASQKTEHVIGEMVRMTQGVAQSSKSMFRVNKMLGIADAIINTARGVTQALAAYPPPLSFAMAGVQLAAGMAQVQAIRSTQFGSGPAPSLAGKGGGSTTVNTVSIPQSNNTQSRASTQQQPIIQFVVEGNFIGEREHVRKFVAPEIQRIVREEDFSLVERGSRNALELAGA